MTARRRTGTRCLGVIMAGALAVALGPAAQARPQERSRTTSASQTGSPAAVPDVLRGDRWIRYFNEDLRPYWTSPVALGTPLGNFPTNRNRDGSENTKNPTRRVRMMSRQVYAYSRAYQLTGDEQYLTWAKAGVDYLLAHAKDPVHGGYVDLLNADGTPAAPTAPKVAADAAFLGLGLVAYFDVTRDPAIEAEILAIRDMLFDPALFFDEANGRVRDALTYDLAAEVDTGGDGADSTVALDIGNAMLMACQPILTERWRRDQVREDLRMLATNLLSTHLDRTTGLFFWGTTGKIGVWGSSNADFGHAHKGFWFVSNVDQLLPDHPFASYVANARAALEFGWDDPYSRWAQAPTSPTTVSYGSTWWGHTEGDILSATLNLQDGRYTDRLARSAQTFLDIFVDHEDPAREGPQLVARDGTWVNATKAGPNKNAFHSTEHALMLYLHGRALEGVPAQLHYAVPADIAMHFTATPYLLRGDVVGRKIRGNVDVLESTDGDGPQRKDVVVSFDHLH